MQSPKAKTMTGLTWLATMALVGYVSGSIVSDNEITVTEVEPDPPESYNFSLVSNVTLPCLGHDGNAPLAWITPSQLVVKDQESFYVTLDVNGTCVREPETGNHVGLAENGSLKLIGLGWRDQGTYRCLWQDPWPLEDDNDGQATNMSEYRVAILIDGIDQRRHTYHISLIYGFATAGGFLLLTLLSKLVYFLLETYGCCLCCCCCKDQLPPKAKKIKVALESIEGYKQQQLDKLKDNYNQQSEWIRQNCAVQMERVRDNYKGQVQHIRDFKQYGSSQISAVREQYFEQMQRIRDYSMGQLDRAHENYIFQRQRLRKFSAQNYVRMRATGKFTQRTLNKVMDNLPPLYLDLSNCRHGMGDRHESINFPPPDFNIEELEAFDPEDGLFHMNKDNNSLYYTPEGSPFREANSDVEKKTNSLKGSPNHERRDSEQKPNYKKHKKSKSFSHFLPQKWVISNVSVISESPDLIYQQKPETKPTDISPQQQTVHVQAIVERITTSDDYITVDDKVKLEDMPETALIGDESAGMDAMNGLEVQETQSAEDDNVDKNIQNDDDHVDNEAFISSKEMLGPNNVENSCLQIKKA